VKPPVDATNDIPPDKVSATTEHDAGSAVEAAWDLICLLEPDRDGGLPVLHGHNGARYLSGRP